MWRSKKFILIGVLAVVVLAATLGGIAIAQANDSNSTQTPANNQATLLDKVAAIYQQNTGTAIDATELQKAFTQAEKSLAADAQDAYLQKLVTDGKITQAEADQYKAWLASRPDVADKIGPFNGGRPGHGMLGGGFRCPPSDKTDTTK